MKRILGFLPVISLLFVMAAPLLAQDSGSVTGRVTDGSNAVIPGVSVRLRSPVIQGEKSSISDESGNYRFILLPPGAYSLTYELPGFAKVVREAVVVEVGKAATLNIVLQVAAVAETVTVTGESPVVDIQNAALGVNFNQALLRDTPNARDVWTVLAGIPGITVTRFDVGGSTMGTAGSFRAFGLSGQNTVRVDGINTTEGSSGAGFYMDYGAFSEIQVSGAANSAEMAVAGTAMNTVIKNGGNQLHGEGYIDWEDDSFQGRNVTEALRDKGIVEGDKFTRYNDFNVNAGGPFQKDKFWWFTSYRDQFSGVRTELKQNDGTPGSTFTTRLQNLTLKLNYQLNATNSLTVTSQGARKFQPYRGGQGASAFQYIVDSTGYQDSYTLIGKAQWVSVLSNKTTLDVSVNRYGYQFPIKTRIQATPLRDDVLQTRRGGYQTPSNSDERRWNADGKLSHFRDNFLGGNHELKLGYGVNWEAPVDTNFPAPGPEGTAGGIVLYYASGKPDRFSIDNSPNTVKNFLLNNYLYGQDKWQIGRRLTLNFGVRYDRYGSYYPDQGNSATGPFATSTAFPKQVAAIFNDIVPRFSFVYDVFGTTKTAVKGSYGRYATNPSVSIASRANPNKLITTTYAWNGTLPITPAYVAGLSPLSISGQATPIQIDSNLKNSYTDEFTAGIEHELFPNLSINSHYVRKVGHNTWDTVNRAQPTSAYVPVAGIDPGNDGVVGTADDLPFTVFERLVAANVDNYLANFDRGDNFATFGFGATKRFSDKWQMITGWDWTKRNLGGSLSLDPNTAWFSASSGEHDTLWTYKLLGSYVLPKGIALSATYNAQKGEAYGRQVRFSGSNLVGRTRNLNQGATTVYVEPAGSYYYPTAHVANVRAEKTFQVSDRQKLTGMFDLFNIFNVNTIVGVNTLTGTTTDRAGQTVSQFGRATQIVQPRIFRLGLRYSF